VSGVAVAQDAEPTPAPVFDYGGFDFGLGKANVALFLTPDRTAADSIAVGSVLDLVWADIDVLGIDVDPALGAGIYHNTAEETRFGPVLTIHADAPVQWLFEEITGWVVNDETAAAIGDSVELRLGGGYFWRVESDFTFSDPEARFTAMAGITLEF